MLRWFASVVLVSVFLAPIHVNAAEYFEEKVHDFGNVPRGPVLVHYFKLTNPHKETLTISSLRVSCGCTTASAPVATIAPGKSINILAQMDSSRFIGHKEVTIFVNFSSPVYEEASVVVRAFGRTDFAMNPDTLAFGAISKESQSTSSMMISFYGDANWTLSKPTPESNYILPSLKLVKREGLEVVYKLTAKLHPRLPVGKWYSDVWIETSNPSMPRIRVPLTVEVQPALVLSQSNIDFGTLSLQTVKDQKIERKVMIRGTKPFQILAIEGASASIQLDKTSGSKAIHVLTIKLKPSKEMDLNDKLTIVTDSGESSLHLAIHAKVIK